MHKPRLAFSAIVIAALTIFYSCKKDSITSEAGSPQIIAFFPKKGAADTVVTIAGINFPGTKDSISVKFGGMIAPDIISVSTNQITVKVPKQAPAGSVKLSVTVAGTETIASQEFLVEPSTWNKLFGGENSDQGAAVARTSDGGYIMAAQTYNNTKGNGDVWIVKTDADGNKLWEKTYGGAGDENPTAIAIAPDGSIIVTATTDSDNTGDVSANHGANDIWVLKLDANGNKIWMKTFGGSGQEYSAAVTIASDGNIVVAAHTSSNNNGDVGMTYGLFDYWIVKLNTNGTIIWQRTFGGFGHDEPKSIISQADGTLVVAGITNSSNSGEVGTTHGSYDAWVLKLDATGSIVWKKIYGGNSAEVVSSIISTGDGGHILAGSTGSSNNGDVGTNHGSMDVWVLKLAADGKLTWQKTFGGYYNEFSNGLCAGPDGSVVIAATTNSNDDGDVGPTHGTDDIWLLKVSSTGALLGQTVMGGTYDDEASGIAPYPGQGYVVVGYTASNKTGDVGASHGSWDAWMFKKNEL